jgi:hypothetical protein
MHGYMRNSFGIIVCEILQHFYKVRVCVCVLIFIYQYKLSNIIDDRFLGIDTKYFVWTFFIYNKIIFELASVN